MSRTDDIPGAPGKPSFITARDDWGNPDQAKAISEARGAQIAAAMGDQWPHHVSHGDTTHHPLNLKAVATHIVRESQMSQPTVDLAIQHLNSIAPHLPQLNAASGQTNPLTDPVQAMTACLRHAHRHLSDFDYRPQTWAQVMRPVDPVAKSHADFFRSSEVGPNQSGRIEKGIMEADLALTDLFGLTRRGDARTIQTPEQIQKQSEESAKTKNELGFDMRASDSPHNATLQTFAKAVPAKW